MGERVGGCAWEVIGHVTRRLHLSVLHCETRQVVSQAASVCPLQQLRADATVCVMTDADTEVDGPLHDSSHRRQ